MNQIPSQPHKNEREYSMNADRPIQSVTADRFRRASFASTIARHLRSAPTGDSFVFSLHGAWGAGKTSVLHMVEEQVRKDDIEVIWFNPWLFSGTEQIASQFMRELGLRLGSQEKRFGRAGELIENYGRLLEVGGTLFNLSALAAGLPGWSIVPGLAGAGLSSALAKLFKAVGKESVSDTRARVEKALRDSGRRVAVFVDDIDRLDSEEIRLIFKMVRLVADFPNVSYVLAFDRPRVERAFAGDDLDGRAYLAKIVQTSFDLPPLDPAILTQMLPEELHRCVEGKAHGPFHPHDWQDIFVQVIRPLVRHPRDVRRYLNVVSPAIDMIAEEVALEDVLALEAIRVFLPDVYEALLEHEDVLCYGNTSGRRLRQDEDGEATRRVQEFIKLGGEHAEVVRALCRFVFPMSRFAFDNHLYGDDFPPRWRKSRRVAAPEVLRVYLERVVRVGEAKATVVRELVDRFDDQASVDAILQGLDSDELESALIRLGDYAKVLARTSFEHGFVAVLQHAERLRRGRTQPFDFGSEIAVSRLLHWTLRSVNDEARRLRIVEDIISRTESFSWREELVKAIGHGDEKSLIPESEIARLREKLREQVLSSSPCRLAAERVPELVARMAQDSVNKTFDPRLRDFLRDVPFFRAMLASVLVESMSWGFGSVAVRKTPRLPWKALREIAGGEESLLELLRAAVDGGPADVENTRLATALRLAEDVLMGRTSITESNDREHLVDDSDDSS